MNDNTPLKMPAPPAFNVAKEMAERFQKALTEVFFPSEKLSDEWVKFARHALHFASPLNLGCKADEFKKMVEALDVCGQVNLNMLQFATLSNNLEARTPNDLDLGVKEYADFITHAFELSTLWNELTKEMKKDIEEKVKQELVMRNAAQNGAAGREGGVLKSMVGEA